MSQLQLLIVGASARAAAQSAARCGLTVATADLFADADLPTATAPRRIRPAEYPGGALPRTRDLAADAWMYTGGLENHPRLVAQLSRRFPLAGVSATVLRQIRDPHQLAESWARHSIPHPAVAQGPRRPPMDRPWLLKPVRSVGGQGIRSLSDLAGSERELVGERHPGCYWQEWIPGPSAAGIFLADGRQSHLCGVTRQWTMADVPASLRPPLANPYQYVGSTGPLSLEPEIAQQWDSIGQAVTQDFGLQGLFGVDAILHPAAGDLPVVVFPVEVNPRYTASVEVLERGLQWQALHDHLAAGRDRPFRPRIADSAPTMGRFAAKLILFAQQDLIVPDAWCQAVAEANFDAPHPDWPVVADIPHPGTRIRRGQPVCTLLATGGSLEEIRQSWGLAADTGQAQRWLADLEGRKSP